MEFLTYNEGDCYIHEKKQLSLRPRQNICVFQVSALKKLCMVGRHNILFYKNILYRNCIFHYIFPDFSAFLTVSSSKFTIKYLGSEQKPRKGWET